MSEFLSEEQRVESRLRQQINENIRLKAYAKAPNYQLLYDVAIEEAVKMIREVEKRLYQNHIRAKSENDRIVDMRLEHSDADEGL